MLHLAWSTYSMAFGTFILVYRTFADANWGCRSYCWYEVSGQRQCSPRGSSAYLPSINVIPHTRCSGHGYQTVIYNSDKSSWQTVGASWTRGLAVHPVGTFLCNIRIAAYPVLLIPPPCVAAAGLTLVAFVLSLSSQVTLTLLASLASFLAALLTLIAFAIDIALYAFVKSQMGKLTGVIEHTRTGPGASPLVHLLYDFTNLSVQRSG